MQIVKYTNIWNHFSCFILEYAATTHFGKLRTKQKPQSAFYLGPVQRTLKKKIQIKVVHDSLFFKSFKGNLSILKMN